MMSRHCRKCGHSDTAHTHFHARTYCGLCHCPRYRRWWLW
jgi:hypothetical protein